MRLAVVGVGRIGAAHAQVVRDHPEVDEVVLLDAEPARATKVAEELGLLVGASLDEELRHVDGLVVTANTAAHPELIIAGARAGVPVFCEKPAASDVTGTRAVLAEVEATGATVQIGFQRRFDAGYQAARQALRSGELGELRRAHVVTADQAPPPAEFIATSGGIFRDCHVHDFDILRWVTGREVAEVLLLGANRGAGYFAEAGDVDECVGLLTLDDGTLVTLQGSRYNGAGHDVRMELAGTSGTHVVGLSERTPLVNDEPAQSFPSGEPWPNFWVRFTPAYAAEVQAFVELVQGKRESPCTVADALEAFYVAEAATLSRLERRPVSVEEVRSA